MKKTPIFRGAGTAILTPFKGDGIDYQAFESILEEQIANEIDAIIVCGTTGEGSTLSDAEHRGLIEFCLEKVNGRTKVIAGTGSNDTRYAVELTRFACEAGVDGVLVVTPYYNKTSQLGLIRHYNVVADAATKPLLIYSVPTRTGLTIQPETYYELSKHPNICGVKEANPDICQITRTCALCGEDLLLYSGNDDQTISLLSLGGQGVISVLSHLVPRDTHLICQKFFEGDIAESRRLQFKYLELIRAIFCEVNPIPIKTAMALLHKCSDQVRMPLCEMEPQHKEFLIRAMKNVGLL